MNIYFYLIVDMIWQVGEAPVMPVWNIFFKIFKN